jgi:uncharacterized protein (TIGR04255 family)
MWPLTPAHLGRSTPNALHSESHRTDQAIGLVTLVCSIHAKKTPGGALLRLILIQPVQFGVIQQAPYSGWNSFYDEARTYWNDLKSIVSPTPASRTSRVSTRSVNRIDIPVELDGQIDLSKYFRVGLSLPDYATTMALQNFVVNCSLLHANGQFINVLQFAAIPSPLIDHLSFTVDVDVATIGAVPRHEDRLWELIGCLRSYKNDLFESCITDDTRKLFQ